MRAAAAARLPDRHGGLRRSAHHLARRLQAMGFDARLIAAHFVSPYRMQDKNCKNDANDVDAFWEATSRPRMRFAPVNDAQLQALPSVHRLREGYKEERTACINRIRGLLIEYGLVFARSPKAQKRRPGATRHAGRRQQRAACAGPHGAAMRPSAMDRDRMSHRLVQRLPHCAYEQ